MEMSKGFIYTLEAIIASSILLGFTFTVIPQFTSGSSLDLQQLQTGLSSLDKRGELKDNLSTEEINKHVDPFIPAGLNYTVEIAEIQSSTGVIKSPGTESLKGSGDFAELQLFIRDASGLNVSYSGVKLIEEQDSEVFREFSLDSTSGDLKLEGTGTVEYRFDVYSKDSGGEITGDNVESYNYPIYSNGSKEIQVKVWRK